MKSASGKGRSRKAVRFEVTTKSGLRSMGHKSIDGSLGKYLPAATGRYGPIAACREGLQSARSSRSKASRKVGAIHPERIHPIK